MKPTYILQQIANILLINHQFISDPGLISGKMGHYIFMAEYARHINSQEYNEYAEKILDAITSQIDKIYSIDFQTGLSGIAWSIDYLLTHNYAKGDPNKILEDIDHSIEKSLSTSFNPSKRYDAPYVIPHHYLLRRYGKEQWKEKKAILRNLTDAIHCIVNSHTDISPSYLKSFSYFLTRIPPNSIDITSPFKEQILQICQHESTISCKDLQQLGTLSWQAVLFNQRIKINFTEKQIIHYIHNITQNINSDDLTMNGFLGIGWGLLHDIYIYEH